jgi:hypothetical protein
VFVSLGIDVAVASAVLIGFTLLRSGGLSARFYAPNRCGPQYGKPGRGWVVHWGCSMYGMGYSSISDTHQYCTPAGSSGAPHEYPAHVAACLC